MSIQVQCRWSHSCVLCVSCYFNQHLFEHLSCVLFIGRLPRHHTKVNETKHGLIKALSLQYNRKHAKMKYHPFHNFWTFHHRKKSVFPSDFFTSIFRFDIQVSIFRFYVWIYQLVADRLHFKWTTAYQYLRTATLQKPHLRSTWRWILSWY